MSRLSLYIDMFGIFVGFVGLASYLFPNIAITRRLTIRTSPYVGRRAQLGVCTIEDRKRDMAKKLATVGQFALFDVFYEDGTQRSNRRVPLEAIGGFDGDAPARAVIEEQDRLIAEKSGSPGPAIKSISRSKGK
jgi:hypothetical protein